MNVEIQQRLQPIREALLHLHKSLVDSERASYEQAMGAIASPNQFLKLLLSDPWFAWLHPLSQLIVSMDELLDAKETPQPVQVDALINQARGLLVASETGEGFSKHYYEALQREPDVVLAHAEVSKLLSPRPAKR